MEKTYTSKCRILHRDGRILKLYIFQPLRNRKPGAKTPGILWIHGGGYVTGMAKMIYMSRALPLVKKYGAVVVTPEYRLSHKAPYPAAWRGFPPDHGGRGERRRRTDRGPVYVCQR